VKLIEVNNLQTSFNIEGGVVKAVNGVSFMIEQEKTLGVVGESGCGKSVTALSIMGLIRKPGKVDGGEILFHRPDGVVNLTALDPKGAELRAIRGNEISMIFQEPMTSLNPVFTIGNQIMESIILHQNLDRRRARQKAVDMLHSVGIPSPEQRVREYPHQLSGGMRQRAMIAMALSCKPSLLIADEPTTALDVTIQAQVLKLMNDLRQEFNASILFITHDLGVIAQMADDVIVMYLGRIVESSPVREIFHNPKHPYTQGLIKSIPSLVSNKDERLTPIDGVVPNPLNLEPGCGFKSRCPYAMDICGEDVPPLERVARGHSTACWLYAKQ
jgi:oligopeptide/dipeptide ABC transporter ATP-binding protein